MVTVLHLALLPRPASLVPSAQLHLAQLEDVGHLPAVRSGGWDLHPGHDMARAGPPPAPPWPPPRTATFSAASRPPPTAGSLLLLRWPPVRAASLLLRTCTWSGSLSTRPAAGSSPVTHGPGFTSLPAKLELGHSSLYEACADCPTSYHSRYLPGRCAAAAVSVCTGTLASRAGGTASTAGGRRSVSSPALYRAPYAHADFITEGASSALPSFHATPHSPRHSAAAAPPASSSPATCPPPSAATGTFRGQAVLRPVSFDTGAKVGGIDGFLAAASNHDHNAMYEDAKPKMDSNDANIRL